MMMNHELCDDMFRTTLSFCSMLARNFFVQCRGNLFNVGAAFSANGYYQKNNRSKIKIAEIWCYSDDNALGFLCNVVWSLLGNIAQGFYLCNVVPRILRQHWTGFSMCNVVWSLLDNIAQGFYLYNVLPSVLRQHRTRVFSCAMLSGASWTTMHKISTCTMLSQEN